MHFAYSLWNESQDTSLNVSKICCDMCPLSPMLKFTAAQEDVDYVDNNVWSQC